MPKQTYIPTEADRLTGENLRRLRRLAGETLQQTIDRSGINLRQSSLSRVELGQRQLTVPEATKLAAHFNTTPDRIIAKAPEPVTEQEWLGNTEPKPLFAVPDRAEHIAAELAAASGSWVTINRDQPLTPDEYREQVWIPYLENRYTADLKAS
jgi:transcriptional regulator with XRE-family HTH domain